MPTATGSPTSGTSTTLPSQQRASSARTARRSTTSTAIFAYNHSSAYVTRVLRIAESYRADGLVTTSDGSPGAWALAYLGTPYVWGGNHASPDSQLGSAQPTPEIARDGRVGFFDCSSLISWAYAKARGVWVGGTTGEQWQIAGETPGAMRNYGSPPDGWQAGDIGFYDSLSHVVLALNSTTFVEAPQTGADVRVGLFSTRGRAVRLRPLPRNRPLQRGTSDGNGTHLRAGIAGRVLRPAGRTSRIRAARRALPRVRIHTRPARLARHE